MFVLVKKAFNVHLHLEFPFPLVLPLNILWLPQLSCAATQIPQSSSPRVCTTSWLEAPPH